MTMAPPVMDEQAVDAAARCLFTLQTTGCSGARLGAGLCPQTPADGWRIQRRVSHMHGSPVLGWKCGLPPADRWVAAALHQAWPSGARLRAPPAAGSPRGSGQGGPAEPGGSARIEPEFAFVLQHHLPPRAQPYTAEEVNAAIGSVRLAIEVLGCRYADPLPASGPELMADSLWHQALVLGPAIESPPVEPAFNLTLSVRGQPDRILPARHPDADARRPLHWLAEFLRQQGLGLQAGQAVITGSLAGVIALPFGHPAVLQYGGLGSIPLTVDPL